MSAIRVFIASPGDVSEERDIASHVVAELSRIFGNEVGVQLEAVRWETHAWPGVGEDAQDVINQQIGEFDLLVGVMWRRFGSPTKRAKSGTVEEFERAYDLFEKHGRPKVMFYFRETPFYTADLVEISQFRKVAAFRAKLEKRGVLYWTYDTPLEFERSVREHLIRQIWNAFPSEESGPEEKLGRPERPSLFLSYSHRDKDAVRSLYRALRASRYQVWFDEQDLLPGQLWHQAVDSAIKSSDVVVLILSSQSDLERGFVAKEIDIVKRQLVAKKGHVLVPVRLDQVEPPAELRHLQWVDYFAADGLERLFDAIDRAWRRHRRQSH